MAPRLELFPFRYRDPRTGKWIRARYVAELHEIKARYAEWEIIGPPEIREVNPRERSFTPHRRELRPEVSNLGPVLEIARGTPADALAASAAPIVTDLAAWTSEHEPEFQQVKDYDPILAPVANGIGETLAGMKDFRALKTVPDTDLPASVFLPLCQAELAATQYRGA